MINCTVKKEISKKSGKEYIALEIVFPNGYKKVVFPQHNSEKFIFEQFIKQ